MPEIALSRGKLPAVVHIPQQTSVGFEAVVPNDTDAKDLARFLERSRLGRARVRVQPVYSVRASELKWTPVGTMPPLRDFVDVVAAWARRHGYGMARDLRELRTGLETLRGGRTAHRVMARVASADDRPVERVLEKAYFDVNEGGLTVELVELASYRHGNDPYRTYVCRYRFKSMGAGVSGQFDLGSAAMVEWLTGALARVLPKIAEADSTKTFSPYESRPKVEIAHGLEVAKKDTLTTVSIDSLTASKVAARVVANKDELLTAVARGMGLLGRLETWVSGFPKALRRAEATAEGLEPGLVWQDEISAFLAEYDTFIPTFQMVDDALEGQWLTNTGKLKDAAQRARRVTREPVGKAGITYPTNDFEFKPHPQKGEHIAYRVEALKTWYKAFSEWVDNGQKVLKAVLQETKKAKDTL